MWFIVHHKPPDPRVWAPVKSSMKVAKTTRPSYLKFQKRLWKWLVFCSWSHVCSIWAGFTVWVCEVASGGRERQTRHWALCLVDFSLLNEGNGVEESHIHLVRFIRIGWCLQNWSLCIAFHIFFTRMWCVFYTVLCPMYFRAVTESINQLITLCTQQAPGQKECDNALRELEVSQCTSTSCLILTL